MKLMHVHAKSNVDLKMSDDVLNSLPKKKWGIVTTIQYQHKIQELIDRLQSATLAGQVIGCNASEAEKIKDQVDAWLFVGSGIFHPVQVAIKTKQDVWLWNPLQKELKQLDPEVKKKFEQQKKVELTKYLSAKTIGIIVSTKIGQKNLMRAKELAESSDKECFLFACDTIDMKEFNNFPFVDFWVNTACPRFAEEKTNMINLDDLIDAKIMELKKEPMAYEVPIWKSKMGLQ